MEKLTLKKTDLTSPIRGVPFLRGSDLDNGKLTLTNARYITQSKHNELISGHLIEDDIVVQKEVVWVC